jgi:hypothetical protein
VNLLVAEALSPHPDGKDVTLIRMLALEEFDAWHTPRMRNLTRENS